MWIKFHWGFSHVTYYMKHSLLGTRRVISSIIIPNFVTRNEQTMTIGTNWMCISRDDNCVDNHVLSTTARKMLSLLSSTCVIRVVLSLSYLFVPYFVMNFVKRTFSEYHSFWSMCESGRMKGFERCFQVEDQGSIWRRQNLHAAIFATACEEDTNYGLWAPFGKRKIPLDIKWAPFGQRKARYGKYWASLADSKARWVIT